MTYYERIQNAINFIEYNLDKKIRPEDAAYHAFLSIAHFYRLFQAFTGFSVKEYITKRRLANILPSMRRPSFSLLDIAFMARYNSHEAFTRAFKREFGVTPKQYKNNQCALKVLEPINLYKEIIMGIVIKDLPEMRVAYCQVISKSPENEAWKKIKQWAGSHKIFQKNYRIFGFDNPEPSRVYQKDEDGNEYPVPAQEMYGYEFWITVQEEYPVQNGIGLKTIPGGKFAVVSINSTDGEDWIGKGWARLNRMLAKSPYKAKKVNGKVRWYEEHLDVFPETDNMHLDLYLEIEEK